MLKEIAKSEAMIIKNITPLPLFSFVHRKDGDIDFVNTFLKEMSDCVSSRHFYLEFEDFLTLENVTCCDNG